MYQRMGGRDNGATAMEVIHAVHQISEDPERQPLGGGPPAALS